MGRHIIYIPGLGDRYDSIRRIGLMLWRRPGVRVTHVPMRWSDPIETYTQKIERIRRVIASHEGKVTLVGESAGGAVAIAARRELGGGVDRVVTVCGMNQGERSVNPRLYEKNKAFHDAMLAADTITSDLSRAEKDGMLILYSSADVTVRPRDTLIDGVKAYDLKIPGHMFAILAVLFFRYRRITARNLG